MSAYYCLSYYSPATLGAGKSVVCELVNNDINFKARAPGSKQPTRNLLGHNSNVSLDVLVVLLNLE